MKFKKCRVLINGYCVYKICFLLIFIFVTIAAIVSEVLSYKMQGFFSQVGGSIWFAAFGVCTLVSIYMVINTIKEEIKTSNILSIIVLAFVTFFIFYYIGNIKMLGMSYEAAIEVLAGINNFVLDDFGYVKNAFVGYPSRQYIVAALPSIIMGRSVLALHLGFALQLFMGIYIFYAGVRRLILDRWHIKPYWAAIIAVSLFTFPYLLEFSLIHEQVIIPFSYTLAAIGWSLLLLDKLAISRAIGLMWVGGMLATSYTPALATWVLLIVILFIVFLKFFIGKLPIYSEYSRKQCIVILAIIWVYLLVIGVSCLIYRDDLIIGSSSSNFNFNLAEIVSGFKIFILGNSQSFLGIMVFPVCLYFVVSLLGRVGIIHFVVSGWSIVVVVLSVVLKGNASPAPEFALHRALVIIPVLVIGMAWLIFDNIADRGGELRPVFCVSITLLFIVAGFWNLYNNHDVFKFNEYVKPMDCIIDNMERQLKTDKINKYEHFEVILYTNDITKEVFKSYIDYLYPNAVLQLKIEDISLFHNIPSNNYKIVYADEGVSLPDAINDYTTIEDIKLKYYDENYNMQRAIIHKRN